MRVEVGDVVQVQVVNFVEDADLVDGIHAVGHGAAQDILGRMDADDGVVPTGQDATPFLRGVRAAMGVHLAEVPAGELERHAPF